jgi:hypothetical protein
MALVVTINYNEAAAHAVLQAASHPAKLILELSPFDHNPAQGDPGWKTESGMLVREEVCDLPFSCSLPLFVVLDNCLSVPM